MTVRLLGLNCSPRDNSNSSLLIAKSFEALLAAYPGEVTCETIHLRELHIEPCKACNVCGKTKDGAFIPCVRADEDDVQAALDAMIAADGLLIAAMMGQEKPESNVGLDEAPKHAGRVLQRVCGKKREEDTEDEEKRAHVKRETPGQEVGHAHGRGMDKIPDAQG